MRPCSVEHQCKNWQKFWILDFNKCDKSSKVSKTNQGNFKSEIALAQHLYNCTDISHITQSQTTGKTKNHHQAIPTTLTELQYKLLLLFLMLISYYKIVFLQAVDLKVPVILIQSVERNSWCLKLNSCVPTATHWNEPVGREWGTFLGWRGAQKAVSTHYSPFLNVPPYCH